MTRDEQIEALRAEVAILADFVKGIYRVAVEIRDDSRKVRAPFVYNPAETATTPKQAALPLDDCAVLPEPGEIARKIAAAPRKWGNSVKFYEAVWDKFGGSEFGLGDLFAARDDIADATKGKIGLSTYQRVLSALVRAGAATRRRRAYRLRQPTDELREAVERVRNTKGGAK